MATHTYVTLHRFGVTSFVNIRPHMQNMYKCTNNNSMAKMF